MLVEYFFNFFGTSCSYAIILWHVMLFVFDGSRQRFKHSNTTWKTLITSESVAVGTAFSVMQRLRIIFKIRDNKKLILHIIIIITSDYIFS
jgi:hypothetical protein